MEKTIPWGRRKIELGRLLNRTALHLSELLLLLCDAEREAGTARDVEPSLLTPDCISPLTEHHL